MNIKNIILIVICALTQSSCSSHEPLYFNGVPANSYVTANNFNQRDNSTFDMYINSQIIETTASEVYNLFNLGLLFSDTYNIEERKGGGFWSNINKKVKFGEVEKVINDGLKILKYNRVSNGKPTVSVSIGYGDHKLDDHSMLVAKHLNISCSKYHTDFSYNYPLWKLKAHVVSNEPDIRVLIVPMIKCATPYLNKNFQGTITCKR